MTLRLTEIDAAIAAGPIVTVVDRLPTFFGGPDDARDRLADASVLVAGSGSVGARTVVEVVRLGVGDVAVVDPKVFKANLGTQPIGPGDVGAPKAVQIGRRAKEIAPATRVRTAVGNAQDLDWAEMTGFDAIVASTDTLVAEVGIGGRAAALGCPLIYASVHGPTLTAQVRVLTNEDGGPCIACGFTETEWAMVADDEARFQCAGAHAGVIGEAAVPTMSVGALCGVAADLATLQLLRLLVGLGRPVENVMLEYNAYTHETTTTPLRTNSTCPIEHATLARGEVHDLASATLRSCAEAVDLADVLDRTLIRVGDLEFSTHVRCKSCGSVTPQPGFGRNDRPVGTPCPSCGGARFMDTATVFTETPGSSLSDVLDRPLATIGAADAGSVTIRGEDRGGLVISARGTTS